jgi:hypothetical protein
MSELSKPLLRNAEIYWRDHQPWLQRSGYMLRQRYMPDWKPSWGEDPDAFRQNFEDGIPLRVCSRLCSSDLTRTNILSPREDLLLMQHVYRMVPT